LYGLLIEHTTKIFCTCTVREGERERERERELKSGFETGFKTDIINQYKPLKT